MRRFMMGLMAGVIAVSFAGDVLAGKGKDKGGKKDEFAAADADKDGKLSATEFATIAGDKNADKKFAKADASKDGFVSPEELKAAKEVHEGKGGGRKGKK